MQNKHFSVAPWGLALAAALLTSSARAAELPTLTGKPDPQMSAVLNQLKALKPKPIEKLTPQEARKQPLPSDAVMAIMKKKGLKPMQVGSIADRMIPGPKGQTRVRVYTPNGTGPFPVIVYFHGGGFVIASIADYDGSCRALANGANAIVAAVDYPLAPENKLPAAHEVSYSATQWIMNNASKWNGDSSRVAVVGESAGGNLATDMCLMAKARGGKMPIHQVLVYPVVQGKMNTQSYIEQANAKPLNKAMMAWFFRHALPNKQFAKSPLVQPLYAPDSMFQGLPPATVILAELDPLRSEGAMYANKLNRLGIPTNMKLYPGVTHEFFGMGAVLDKARNAEAYVSGQLANAFHKR